METRGVYSPERVEFTYNGSYTIIPAGSFVGAPVRSDQDTVLDRRGRYEYHLTSESDDVKLRIEYLGQ